MGILSTALGTSFYLVFSVVIYLSPAFIAFFRKHQYRREILLGNVLLGWTGIGWLVLLGISFNDLLPPAEAALTIETTATVLDDSSAKALELPESRNTELHRTFQELIKSLVDPSAKLAQQAEAQLRLIEKHAENVANVLRSKLSPEEITFKRYMSAADQVYRSVVGNLSIAASLLKSIEAVDPTYIAERLAALRCAAETTEQNSQEARSLEERSALVSSQIEKLATLISRNEHAMTEFAKLIGALAEMNIVEGRVPVELASALAELESLLSRVKLYDQEPVRWGAASPKKSSPESKS